MRNERPADLDHEEQARAGLEAAWRCMIQPLNPKLYRVDWALFKDRKTFIGWAEYKYRGVEMATGKPVKWESYPSVMMSLGKWMTLKTLAQQSNRQFFVFFEWSDCLVYAKWPQFTGMGYPIEYGIELGGRTDRGQDGDTEPVILIPNREFKIVPLGNKLPQIPARDAGVPAQPSTTAALPNRSADRGEERAAEAGGGAET